MKKYALFSLFTASALASSASAAVIGSIGMDVGVNEFSGIQGQDGWSYGYWDVTNDASPGTYTHTTDFSAFPGGSDSGAWSDTNHWNSNRWDFNPVGAGTGNPPWTTITATNMHPNDSVPGEEHYAVLRYTVEDSQGDTLLITGLFNNVSPNADGTNGRIIHNGVEQYSALTNGTTDTLGGGVTITGVSTGDIIDFMVDTGPADNDGNDGTNYGFTIERIPEPSSLPLLLGGLALTLRRRRSQAF